MKLSTTLGMSKGFQRISEVILNFLNEQGWFQSFKEKWEELDPHVRIYIRWISLGLIFFSGCILILGQLWFVYSLKKQCIEKESLLNQIQEADVEIRRLQGMMPHALQTLGRDIGVSAWKSHFESIAITVGIDRAQLSMSEVTAVSHGREKDVSEKQSQESLFDLDLKHVSIKLVIKYILALESGQKPVKVRNLFIETKGDALGYLDSTVSVSVFSGVKP